MIYTVLHYIVHQLNENLKLQFSEQVTTAILSNLLDENGSVPLENQNKIILSLVNLEVEKNIQYDRSPIYKKDFLKNQPYSFNLDVLVSSLYNDYGEALKFLSETINFFQAKPLFTRENSPGLDSQIQKVSVEFVNLKHNEMHNIWSAMGVKYLPSFLLKIRLISFRQETIPVISISTQEVMSSKDLRS